MENSSRVRYLFDQQSDTHCMCITLHFYHFRSTINLKNRANQLCVLFSFLSFPHHHSVTLARIRWSGAVATNSLRYLFKLAKAKADENRIKKIANSVCLLNATIAPLILKSGNSILPTFFFSPTQKFFSRCSSAVLLALCFGPLPIYPMPIFYWIDVVLTINRIEPAKHPQCRTSHHDEWAKCVWTAAIKPKSIVAAHTCSAIFHFWIQFGFYFFRSSFPLSFSWKQC